MGAQYCEISSHLSYQSTTRNKSEREKVKVGNHNNGPSGRVVASCFCFSLIWRDPLEREFFYLQTHLRYHEISREMRARAINTSGLQF